VPSSAAAKLHCISQWPYTKSKTGPSHCRRDATPQVSKFQLSTEIRRQSSTTQFTSSTPHADATQLYSSYSIESRRRRRCESSRPSHGRWNRGSRGSSCSPNFWHGRAGHSSCSPKSLSLLHCDVRLSQIDLDILEFCRSVRRSRTKKLSASGGFAPLTPTKGSAPGPRWGLRPQTPL